MQRNTLMKKILSLLLVLIMILALFSACANSSNKKNNGDDKKDNSSTDDKNNENKEEPIYEIDISNHQIIRQQESSPAYSGAFTRLRNSLSDNLGISANITKDSDDSKTDDAEILIGKTNRKESTTALEFLSSKYKKEAFLIGLIDNKIVISGLSDNDTVIGVLYFVNNFIEAVQEKDGKVRFKNDKYIGVFKTGDFHASCNDGQNAVVLERLETVYKVDDLFSKETFTYGKIIKLEHQSDKSKNGILIATNENVKGEPWALYHSYDDGKTWKVSDPVVDTINEGISSGYQSFIYELPVDIGDFKKGTVLFSGCSYGKDATKLPLFASTDQGKTWKGVHNIAEGGANNQGGWTADAVWEPCIVYDDSTKRLYCFYSDEQDPNHNQRLVYKYTDDLKTWSEAHNAVALGASRPGMAMVTKMGNGQWALVYEYGGNPVDGGSLVFIKFTDDITSWNPSDPGKLLATKSGQCFGSSPAIAWTPAGGKCGTLIATGYGNVNGSKGTKCDLFLSFDYGQTFVTVKNPIPVTWNEYNRTGYSPGLYVDAEGDVYCINDPENYKGGQGEKLMFAKIKIY